MKEQEITFKRETLTLQGRLAVPDQENFDLAILIYGFAGQMINSPSNLLPELAKKLWQQGIATLRFDFAGHGDSDGEIEDMNVFSQLEDAAAALVFARTVPGVEHIYFVGHSQGGVVASMIAGYYSDQIDKEVLVNPAATLVDDAKIGTCWGTDYDTAHIPDKIKLAPFTLKGFYFRTAKFLNIYDVASAFTNPALVLTGADDQIVNNYASKHYHAVLPNNEFHVLDGGNHNMDSVREELDERIINFLTR